MRAPRRPLHPTGRAYRGGPGQTGVASSLVDGDLELLWAVDTAAYGDSAAVEGSGGIESTAAISGGTVYIGTLGGRLLAAALADGRIEWAYEAAGEVKSSPAVHGNDRPVRRRVRNLPRRRPRPTAPPLWTFAAEGAITSSPNLSEGRVLFGSYDNHLYCLALADGELLWKFETGGFVHASPAVAGTLAVAGGCDGQLRLIGLRTGVEAASLQAGQYIAASAAVAAGTAFAGTFDNEVVAVDLAEARFAWRYAPERQFPFYSSAAVSGGTVVVGGRDKQVHALDAADGTVRWTYAAGARVDSSPVIAGERVFVATTAGRVAALDLAAGGESWRFETGESFTASPAAAAGRLVIGSQDGMLYCFGNPG